MKVTTVTQDIDLGWNFSDETIDALGQVIEPILRKELKARLGEVFDEPSIMLLPDGVISFGFGAFSKLAFNVTLEDLVKQSIDLGMDKETLQETLTAALKQLES